VPQPIHLFQRDGRVVLAYGDAAARDALNPSAKLGDTQAYKDAQEALGGDYDLSFYLGFEPILELVDSTGAGDDEGWRKVKPYLEPLGALVIGAKKDGDKLRSAFGLTVK
jgi:phytoene dehydrogenase-like protein